jgi:hypothetical protein
MVIPNAETIEQAASQILGLPVSQVGDQIRELREFGDGRERKIGAPGITADFCNGYTLGLQTARTMMANSAVLAVANVDPNQIL